MTEKITGTVQSKVNITGSVQSNGIIGGSVSAYGGKPIRDYEGDYTVVPKLTETVLNTNGKRMNDDVAVKEVPVHRTINASGKSNTIYIG